MKYDYDPVPLNYPKPLDDETLCSRSVEHYARLSSRRTVRDFSDRPVPKAVIEACIRTAGSAPSGANHQPWHFVCVSDPDIKREIRLAAEAEERAFTVVRRAISGWMICRASVLTRKSRSWKLRRG